MTSNWPLSSWPRMPAWPRSDGNPLTGWRRARFVLALWRHGRLSVRSFQRDEGIRVDGLVGVQTWLAFWVAYPR